MTSKQSQQAAKKLGYEKTNYRAKNGEPIYYNKKTKTYISQDIGSADGSGPHNGGGWKMGKSPQELKNITIRDIIYSRIDFIENNNIFDKKEYMYVNKGEIEAYSEILTDIELLTIDAFVEKYLCILKKVSEKLDNEHNLGDNEQERMSGYNNAIVFVLSLINPIYEYELE